MLNAALNAVAKDNLDDLMAEAQAPVAISEVPLKGAESETWQVITCLQRLDGENHSDLMQQIHSVLAEGARFVALDLTQTRFFSLNAIQLCVSLARDLSSDDGQLALVGCAERTKRHFEVYGSLKQIVVVRATAELVNGRVPSVSIRPRVSSPEVR